MLRAALYARFSTDMQSEASIDDQLRVCEGVAARIGATVTARYSDAAISGTTVNRPGLQALLADAQRGKFDVVIAEALDRLTRSGGAAWDIFEDLAAAKVRIHTLSEGPVEEMAVILKGGMNALFVKELAHKTRRGLQGVVRAGRSAGGLPYGYRIPLAYDAAGERLRGLREPDPDQAGVVRRIFEAYARGDSPLAIAGTLNAEAIAGPRGGPWNASTIHGAAKAQTGILRNELYRGVRVWGRNTMVKDRQSGRRKTLAGQSSAGVQRVTASELQIVPDDLWERVQARLGLQAIGPAGENKGQRRPKVLFGGLIRCSGCGGVMTRGGSGDHLRCNTRAQQGPDACWNTRTPSYGDIERRVLRGVEANLLHPAAIAEAVKAFNQTLAAERRTAGSDRSALERELADVGRRAERLTREVEEGMPWALVKDRHAQLTARSEEIRARLATMSADVIPLQPSGAVAYRKLFADLSADLAASDAGEAREAVRALIEEVKFFPGQARGVYELEVAADLSPLLAANETGLRLVRASNSRSRIHRSHGLTVRFRLAG